MYEHLIYKGTSIIRKYTTKKSKQAFNNESPYKYATDMLLLNSSTGSEGEHRIRIKFSCYPNH